MEKVNITTIEETIITGGIEKELEVRNRWLSGLGNIFLTHGKEKTFVFVDEQIERLKACLSIMDRFGLLKPIE